MSYLEDAANEHEKVFTNIGNNLIAQAAGAMFWKWYSNGGSNLRVKVKVSFFRPSVKLEALEPLFLLIFPRPAGP